jgi:hypothetical protein
MCFGSNPNFLSNGKKLLKPQNGGAGPEIPAQTVPEFFQYCFDAALDHSLLSKEMISQERETCR